MEGVKILYDLQVIHKTIRSSFLTHFYHRFDAFNFKELAHVMQHLLFSEAESSDQRNAYHQFCDWVYGWNVAEATEFATTDAVTEEFTMKRVPRTIDITEKIERSECERLKITFETLVQLSKRSLNKTVLDLEDNAPKVGVRINAIALDSSSRDKTHFGEFNTHIDLWAEKAKELVAESNSSSMENIIVNEEITKVKENHFSNPKIKETGLIIEERIDSLKHGKAIQEDLNLLYIKCDKNLDYILRTLVNSFVIATFSELLQDPESFLSITSVVHETACNSFLKTIHIITELVQREITDLSWKQFRKFSDIETHLAKVNNLRPADSNTSTKNSISNIHPKISVINRLLEAFDIFIFPKHVAAHEGGVKAVRDSVYDQNIWLTAGYDGVIRIHDIDNNDVLAQYIGHKSIITDAIFIKNDAQIISCSFDRTVKLWNSHNASCEKTLTGHLDAVMAIDVSPDEKYVASASMDNTVRIWDLARGTQVAVCKKHNRWVKTVKFSKDSRHLFSGGIDWRIYMWDIKTVLNSKTPTYSRCIESHTDSILSLAVHKDLMILSTSRDQTVKIHDYLSGNELHSISLQPSWACCAAFGNKGNLFAVGTFDNNVFVFDTKSVQLLRQLRIYNTGILSIAFSRPDDYLVVGTQEGFVQKVLL